MHQEEDNMIRKIMGILMALVLAVALTACGGEEETTLSGMVVSLEGTVVSLVEMEGTMDFAEGERPEMPEGMEGFEGFDPEAFEGTFPAGENFPQWGEGEMPEGMTPPEDMTVPEGMTMPENGEMPDFGGENGGMRPGFSNFAEDMETKDVDIANAHISLEIDGGKASGTLEDVVPGAFVTITVNGKGEATYVLVSAQSGFGGRGMNNR